MARTRVGWECPVHGVVEPLGPATAYGPTALGSLLGVLMEPRVPAWSPWPVAPGWGVAGLRWAGATRPRAVAVGAAGPGLLGPAEMVLVAEEPGIGLGARYGGLAQLDPGSALAGPSHDAVAHAAGHPVSLWAVPGVPADRVTYAGEAAGCWLWITVWPDTEWLVVHDLNLVDLSDPDHVYELPSYPPLGRLLG